MHNRERERLSLHFAVFCIRFRKFVFPRKGGGGGGEYFPFSDKKDRRPVEAQVNFLGHVTAHLKDC